MKHLTKYNHRHYDFASFFVDGIACVSIDDKYGKYKYGGINTDGILVIPCIYDNIFYFENGIALVEKDDQVGLQKNQL